MLVTLAGQRQLLVVTAKRAVGLTVEDGKLLWEHPWSVLMNNHNIAQPVMLSTNRFMLSAGYRQGLRGGGNNPRPKRILGAPGLEEQVPQEQVHEFNLLAGTRLRTRRGYADVFERGDGRAPVERRALRVRAGAAGGGTPDHSELW